MALGLLYLYKWIYIDFISIGFIANLKFGSLINVLDLAWQTLIEALFKFYLGQD
jgi:hypothetical protein